MMGMRSGLRRSAVLFVLLSPVAAAAQEEYDRAMQRAAALEKEKRYTEAAAVLEPLVRSHPQDYPLFLKLGWLHFNAKSYNEALVRYETAYRLSDGGTEPLLGTAWTRLCLGERENAEQLFRKVLQQEPGNASARDGLKACSAPPAKPPDPGPGLAATLSLNGTFHNYSSHPRKEWAVGGAALLDLILDRNYRLSAGFRYTHFDVEETTFYTTYLRTRRRGGTSVSGSASTSDDSFGQEEVYLAAGVTYPDYDVAGHFVFAEDDGELDNVYAVGGSGRLRIPHGDLFGEISLSDYDDEEVFRAAAAWEAPVSDRFSVRPGLAFQVDDDDGYFTAFVTATFHGQWGRVFAGAKAGEESRPLYLSQPSIYNLWETIKGGFWAGVRLTVEEGTAIDVVYEQYFLDYDEEGVAYDSDMRLFTVGISRLF